MELARSLLATGKVLGAYSSSDRGLAAAAAIGELAGLPTPQPRHVEVCLDNENARFVWNEAGIHEKFGVAPESIPDYLALVGDSADGFPGLKGWGAKSSASILARYVHLEEIPTSAADWDVKVRGADKLAATLAEQKDLALLFRRIATVDRKAPVSATVDELEWRGAHRTLESFANVLQAPELSRQAEELTGQR